MGKLYKKLESNFTVCTNNIFKYELSLKAIGLYTYLISKPDSWDFSVEGISKQTKDGRDSVRSAVQELENTGFLCRRDDQGNINYEREAGKFIGADWDIYDSPCRETRNGTREKGVEKPLTEKPSSVKPSSENPTQVNTIKVKTDLVKKRKTSKKKSLDSLPAGVVPTSKNSLTACTELEIWELAMKLDVSIQHVRTKHTTIMEMIECGDFQRKYPKHKTVYLTLKRWIEMGLERGYYQHCNEIEEIENRNEHPDNVAKRNEALKIVEEMRKRGEF